MTWHRLASDTQPTEGQMVKVLRVYWVGAEHGWATAIMHGVAQLTRPELEHEGWTVRYNRPGGFLMIDDLSCATTNIDEISAPFDFNRTLPDGLDPEVASDAIFWREE